MLSILYLLFFLNKAMSKIKDSLKKLETMETGYPIIIIGYFMSCDPDLAKYSHVDTCAHTHAHE